MFDPLGGTNMGKDNPGSMSAAFGTNSSLVHIPVSVILILLHLLRHTPAMGDS